jgi:pimeloyl-ACP methyl ester carboxylesterase
MSRFIVGLGNEGAPYTLYDMADDVSMLIDQLGLEKTYLIGASMGGMISKS